MEFSGAFGKIRCGAERGAGRRSAAIPTDYLIDMGLLSKNIAPTKMADATNATAMDHIRIRRCLRRAALPPCPGSK